MTAPIPIFDHLLQMTDARLWILSEEGHRRRVNTEESRRSRVPVIAAPSQSTNESDTAKLSYIAQCSSVVFAIRTPTVLKPVFGGPNPATKFVYCVVKRLERPGLEP